MQSVYCTTLKIKNELPGVLAILPLCSIRKMAQNIDKLASLPTHAKLFLDLVRTTLVEILNTW